MVRAFFMVVFKPLHARKSCRSALAGVEAGVSVVEMDLTHRHSRASALLQWGVHETNAEHEYTAGLF
jgi:hypothetical protein